MNYSNIPTLSRQRSYERLQLDADRLFDIGWLIERLTQELREILGGEALPIHPRLFRSFRGNAEHWFVWEMLHAHTKSIGKVRDLLQLFPDRQQLISHLHEEREQQIEAFSQLLISKRWDSLRDDDSSWRLFARKMFSLKETTTETAERFFALADYIFMLTLVILGKEGPYLLDTSGEEAPYPAQTAEAPNLDAIDVRAELKLFLKEGWFDKFSTDRKRFTPEWRDAFVKALLESDYGEEIIADFTNPTHDRRQIIKGAIVGCLKAAGALNDSSDLSIARTILYPNEAILPNDQEKKAERQKNSKTLSSYIGREKKQKYYYWVIDWVKGSSAEE